MASRSNRNDSPVNHRRATNVSLDPTLVRDARDFGINLSRACETGLKLAIADARAQRWLAENSDAIEASNAWVAEHGLPLAKHRPF